MHCIIIYPYTYHPCLLSPLYSYDKARVDAHEAIKLNPENDSAWGNRSCSYIEVGDYDQAISDAKNSLRLNPHNTASRYNLLSAYLRRAGLFISAEKGGNEKQGEGSKSQVKKTGLKTSALTDLIHLNNNSNNNDDGSSKGRKRTSTRRASMTEVEEILEAELEKSDRRGKGDAEVDDGRDSSEDDNDRNDKRKTRTGREDRNSLLEMLKGTGISGLTGISLSNLHHTAKYKDDRPTSAGRYHIQLLVLLI